MSRSVPCFNATSKAFLSSVIASTSRTVTGRNYAQVVLKKRERVSKAPNSAFVTSRPWRQRESPEPEEEYQSVGSTTTQNESFLDQRSPQKSREPERLKLRERVDYSTMREPDPVFTEHLDGLFPGLHFPKELARRILTHASHPAAVYGHNGGLSFLGRRVLQSYLLLLISSSPHLRVTDDLEEIVSRTLNTYVLGEHIGSKWGLGRVMRWTPTVKAEKLVSHGDKTPLLKSVGLYKVQGDTVSAVMGGIYHQFGGSVALRVFHTRVLPQILLGKKQDGLPEAFHGDVRSVCNAMGGLQGPLIVETQSPKVDHLEAS